MAITTIMRRSRHLAPAFRAAKHTASSLIGLRRIRALHDFVGVSRALKRRVNCRPATQPTIRSSFCAVRGVWQSPRPVSCCKTISRSAVTVAFFPEHEVEWPTYCRLVGTLGSRRFLAQFSVREVGLPKAGTGRRIGLSPPASAVPFHRDAEA